MLVYRFPCARLSMTEQSRGHMALRPKLVVPGPLCRLWERMLSSRGGWLSDPGSGASLKMFCAEQVIKYSNAGRGMGIRAVHRNACSQNKLFFFSHRPALTGKMKRISNASYTLALLIHFSR